MHLPVFGILGFGILESLIGAVVFCFWIWMLIDCALHEEPAGSKIAWILILLLANCIGAPVYFFVRYLPRRR